jgi:hypothetical protein
VLVEGCIRENVIRIARWFRENKVWLQELVIAKSISQDGIRQGFVRPQRTLVEGR